MLGFRQRTASAGEKQKRSDAPPLEPPWGHTLRRHHMQTIIICIWVLCIIAYIGAIEKAIAEHSQPTSNQPGAMGVAGSFGGRGTRRRQEAVQILSFARTILTAVHVCSEMKPLLDDPISRLRGISWMNKVLTVFNADSNHYRRSCCNYSNSDAENPWQNGAEN